jgi:amino acid transporter
MLCAISISCAASRATWSFARDKAIPFHEVFSRVNHKLDDVPVFAHILSTVIQLLLGLIFLGSTAAFNAFTSVAVISLQASYAMPVAISLATGRKHVVDAPFNLGRWGLPLNVIAVLWTSFQLVLFSMPAVIPVTQASMSEFLFYLCPRRSDLKYVDYASVVFVGFAVISAVWYLIGMLLYFWAGYIHSYILDGRFHYAGPPLPDEGSQPGSPRVLQLELEKHLGGPRP